MKKSLKFCSPPGLLAWYRCSQVYCCHDCRWMGCVGVSTCCVCVCLLSLSCLLVCRHARTSCVSLKCMWVRVLDTRHSLLTTNMLAKNLANWWWINCNIIMVCAYTILAWYFSNWTTWSNGIYWITHKCSVRNSVMFLKFSATLEL